MGSVGEMTFWEKIREWLGDRCFELFLWFRNWTEEHYVELIRQDSPINDAMNRELERAARAAAADEARWWYDKTCAPSFTGPEALERLQNAVKECNEAWHATGLYRRMQEARTQTKAGGSHD